MRNLFSWFVPFAGALFCTPIHTAAGDEQPKPGKIKVLIIDGQNNHAWQKTTPVLKAALESVNLFTVDVATSPAHGQKMDGFRPGFARYDVVLSNYNGDEWPEATKKAFEDYVLSQEGRDILLAAGFRAP